MRCPPVALLCLLTWAYGHGEFSPESSVGAHASRAARTGRGLLGAGKRPASGEAAPEGRLVDMSLSQSVADSEETIKKRVRSMGAAVKMKVTPFESKELEERLGEGEGNASNTTAPPKRDWIKHPVIGDVDLKALVNKDGRVNETLTALMRNKTEATSEIMIDLQTFLKNKWRAQFAKEGKEKTIKRAEEARVIENRARGREKEIKSTENAEKVNEGSAKKKESKRLAAVKNDLVRLQTLAEKQKIAEMKPKALEHKSKMREEGEKKEARAVFMEQQQEATAQMAIEKGVKKQHYDNMDARQRKMWAKTDDAMTKEEEVAKKLQKYEEAFERVDARFDADEKAGSITFHAIERSWDEDYNTEYKAKEAQRDARNEICDLRMHYSAVNRVRHSANVLLDHSMIAARDRAQSRGMDTMEEMFATWHEREVANKNFEKLGSKTAKCPICEEMYPGPGGKKFKGPTPCATEIMARKHKGIPGLGVPPDPSLKDCKEEAKFRAENYWQSKERYNKYVARLSEVRTDWIEHSDKEKREKQVQLQERRTKGQEVKTKKNAFVAETKTFVDEHVASIERMETLIDKMIPDLQKEKDLGEVYADNLKTKITEYMPKYYKEQNAKQDVKFERGKLDHIEHHASLALVQLRISQEPRNKAEAKSKVGYHVIAFANEQRAEKQKKKTTKSIQEYKRMMYSEQQHKNLQMKQWATDTEKFIAENRAVRAKLKGITVEKRGKVAAIDDKMKNERNIKSRTAISDWNAKLMQHFKVQSKQLKSDSKELNARCLNLTMQETIIQQKIKIRAMVASEKAAHIIQQVASQKIPPEEGEAKMKADNTDADKVVMMNQRLINVVNETARCVMDYKKTQSNMIKNQMNYTLGIESRGCDWMECDATECPGCDKGYFPTSSPAKDPMTQDCICKCGCKMLGGIVKPSDMAWVQPLQVKKYGYPWGHPRPDTTVIVETRPAVCASTTGRQFYGCIGEKKVPSYFPVPRGIHNQEKRKVACGCKKEFYLQGFAFKLKFPEFRTADENKVGAGFWKSAIPLEQYRQGLLEHITVCTFGAEVTERMGTECPAGDKDAAGVVPAHVKELQELMRSRNSTEVLLQLSGQAPNMGKSEEELEVEKRVAAGLLVTAARNKERQHKKDYKRELAAVKLANDGRESTTNAMIERSMFGTADKWVKNGYMDPRKHDFMYLTHTHGAMSYEEPPKPTQVATLPYKQAIYDEQRCYQKFIYMWTLCGDHRGQPVTLYCKTSANGPTMIINNAGCHCQDGFLAHSRFEGHMPIPDIPAPCAPLFLKWSAEARDRYMNTGPIRGCGMQLERRCIEQRKHANEKTKMARTKKDIQEANKDFNLKKLIRTYDRGLDKATEEIGKLQTQLRAPAYDYVHIPGLRLTGKDVAGVSAAGCRQHCNTRGNCKSYSYSETSQKCFWSEAKLNYNPAFNLYLKIKQKGGTNKDFFTIPGLKSLDDDNPDTVIPEEIATFGECKYACFKNEECGAFSYGAAKSLCLGEGQGMIYDTDFHYYEKASTLEGGTQYEQEKMQIKLANENNVKQKLRQDWLNIVEEQSKLSKAKGNRKWHDQDKENLVSGAGEELGASRGPLGKAGEATKGWTQMRIPGLVDSV